MENLSNHALGTKLKREMKRLKRHQDTIYGYAMHGEMRFSECLACATDEDRHLYGAARTVVMKTEGEMRRRFGSGDWMTWLHACGHSVFA